MAVLGEATIVVKLDPESLATVERLERLADRLESLIPATEGAIPHGQPRASDLSDA